MKIFLDFDGTVVEHNFPKIGKPVPNAINIVKSLIKNQHEVILNTYRSMFFDGSHDAAIQYLTMNDINIQSCGTKYHPQRWDLEEAMNNGVLYIDDSAENTPLIPDSIGGSMVNWDMVENELKKFGLIHI